MLNTLITLTLAFAFILPIVGFIAYAHDSIMARKQPTQAHTEMRTFKLGFKPSLVPQASGVVNSAPIRTLKAIAAVHNLTTVTRELYGKRYSLCNAVQLREAFMHYAQQ